MSEVKPFVSVIMPIRNEEAFIETSLGAVLNQDYPHNRMEVLISDGMSTDKTREIIQQIAKNSDIQITLVDNPAQIVAPGFNVALNQSKGEIIVRVDGHCKIASDYVSQSVKHLLNGEAVGVGGPLETISHTPVGQAIALAMSSKFGVGGSSFRTVKNQTMYVDTIAFPTYTRKIMDEVGPLDEEFVRNQDDEYNFRIRSKGYKLLLTPAIKSEYYSRATRSGLFKQYFQYGLYKVRVMQKHPQQMRPRQFIPVIFVVALMFALILSLLVPFGLVLLMLVGGSYLVANFLASSMTASGSNKKYLTQLPLIFTILHVAYGLGFLLGLIKFANRWNDKDLTP